MDLKTKNKITYVSFVLALFIVWHHTYNVEVYELNGFLSIVEKYLLYVFDTAVSLFFIISAFLFYYNLDENNLFRKLRSRLFSLIIPYLIWNIIGYLYFQIISLFPFIRDNYAGEISGFSFLGLIKSAFLGDYNLVTWFLRNLIIYTYTFPIIFKLLKNKYVYYFIFLSTLIISYLFASKSEIVSYVSYYLLGIGFGIHFKEIFVKRFSKSLIITSLFIFLLLIAIFTYYNFSDTSIQRIFIYLFASVFLWIIFDVFAIETEPKWWMGISFVIYVSHEMILEPIEKIILLLLGKNVFGAIFDYVFAPVIALFIIIIISFVLRKIPVIWKVISGSR